MDASTYDGLSEKNIVTVLLISQSLHFSKVLLLTIHVIIVDFLTDLQNIVQVVGAPSQSSVMLYCRNGMMPVKGPSTLKSTAVFLPSPVILFATTNCSRRSK